MNLNKENDDEERKKLFDLNKLLVSSSEANTRKINSCKGKIETINNQILQKKKLVDYYENKLEELMTEIANTEWSQIKAKTVLKADIQFAEEFKNKFIDNKQQVHKIQDESITNKILELKQEKENLEMQCKTNDKIMEELYKEYQEVKEDI